MAASDKGNCPPPLLEVNEKQKQEDEYKQQLLQLEKEIQTLKKVLQAKCAEASELKTKLGISPMNDLKEDIKHGIQVIQESEAVQKTNAALKSIGQYATKTVGTIKNSSAVKSIEDKVGTAYNTVKQRLSNSNIFTSTATDGVPVDKNKCKNTDLNNSNNTDPNSPSSNENSFEVIPDPDAYDPMKSSTDSTGFDVKDSKKV